MLVRPLSWVKHKKAVTAWWYTCKKAVDQREYAHIIS